MPVRNPRRLAQTWLAIAVAVIAAGCESGAGGGDLGPPDLAASRRALAVSLDAWKAGRRASGVLIGSGPAVGVVDSNRADRPLADYEVVGPLMVAGKSRPFAVRLVLDAPRETVEARYVVVGRDPLWVFRHEDFERMLHWEHRMDPESTPSPPTAAP